MGNTACPKVSCVIIYTKDEQIKECEKWIDAQEYDGEIEKIILDNKGNKGYNSAASALNDGAAKSTGEILFFMHQDVYLWDKNAIKTCVLFLLSQKENTIIGAAGIIKKDCKTHYDMWQGKDKKRYELPLNGKIEEAITVDECFFAMKKSVWEDLGFDEITFNDWHFYGADICYHNFLSGGENYVLPLEICHESIGAMNSVGFKTGLKKFVIKYKGKIKKIQTTCVRINCTEFSCAYFLCKFSIKTFIKNILRKIGLYSDKV